MDNSLGDSQNSQRFRDKLLKDPSVSLGLIALTGIVGYGAYVIKSSKGKRLSLQLIHLRLAAQGSFIGFLTLGVVYSICKNHLGLFQPENEKR